MNRVQQQRAVYAALKGKWMVQMASYMHWR